MEVSTGRAIRVVTIDAEPWFVAADVCQTLSIYIRADGFANTSIACRKLAHDEKQTYSVNPIIRGAFGKAARVILVSESGLYRLVMRSDKPQAKSFQDWVARIVLPAIRKDGGYIMGEEKVASGQLSEDELARAGLRQELGVSGFRGRPDPR